MEAALHRQPLSLYIPVGSQSGDPPEPESITMTRTAPAVFSIFMICISLITALPVSARDQSDESNYPVRFQDGDLVFQRSKSQLGAALEKALNSKITHLGVVFVEDDSAFVYESRGEVKRTPFNRWVSRGVEHRFAVMRLRHADSALTASVLNSIRGEFKRHEGKSYDVQFDWDDERFYCSELVYKMFKRGAGIDLGRIDKFGDFNLEHDIVQYWIGVYFPDGPNLDKTVVSPVSIYYDTELETVYTTMPERGITW